VDLQTRNKNKKGDRSGSWVGVSISLTHQEYFLASKQCEKLTAVASIFLYIQFPIGCSVERPHLPGTTLLKRLIIAHEVSQ